MTPFQTPSPAQISDAALVALARNGDRNAFGGIVARYQGLVCALAYNATGSLARSEDVAQEAFVVAWQKLPELREPEKLRAWLCGIVRNLGRRARRGEKYEPVLQAQTLESAPSLIAPEPEPNERAINSEEEGILWRQLEAIPEIYREPLILFYRENASIEQVAEALDLSQEAVRQRLSRGRKLLQDQVAAFVERALVRSSPKPAFAGNVLAALPLASAPLKVAAVAAIGPLGTALPLLGGAVVTSKGIAAGAKSPREQRFVSRIAWVQTLLPIAVLAGGILLVRHESAANPVIRDLEYASVLFGAWALNCGLWRWRTIRQREIQIEEKTYDPTEWNPHSRQEGAAAPSKAALPFSAHLKRAGLSLAIIAICACRAPWRTHVALSLAWNIAVPLLTLTITMWLSWRLGFRRRSRFRRPRLIFLLGFPIAITLVAMDADLLRLWSRGLTALPAILLANLAVVVTYAAWTAGFLRLPRRSDA